MDAGSVTLSFHEHGQERNKLKGTSGKHEHFDLEDFGLSSRFETDDPWGGRLAYGAEFHRESISSGGYSFDENLVRGTDLTQGPLAADAGYNRLAFYLSDTFETEAGLTLEPGVRYSKVEVDADRWYKSTSNGTAMPGAATPGT